MTQVIVIHGGTTFSSYEKYIEHLKIKTVSKQRFLNIPIWRDDLQSALGEQYQVLLPSMPNKTNATYFEWKTWFDRIGEVAEDGCILVGHSLGGAFLAKYLSENIFPNTIRSTILVAAPYDDETVEDLTEFKLSGITDLFSSQAGKIVLFNGHDDPVIPLAEMDKYKIMLPSADFHVISAPDHFARPEFPELVLLIQNLNND